MANTTKRITDVDIIDSLNGDESFFVNQNSSIKQINKTNVVFGVNNGGTGATDASAARENLGINLENLGAADANHNHAKSVISPSAIQILPEENAGHGGYIDFHYNGSSGYTTRIIENDGKLMLGNSLGENEILTTNNCSSIKLLWANRESVDEFGKQKISLDLSEYPVVLVVGKAAIRFSDFNLGDNFIPEISEEEIIKYLVAAPMSFSIKNLFGGYISDDTGMEKTRRFFIATDDGVTFADAFIVPDSSGGSAIVSNANTYCCPCYIFGIKFPDGEVKLDDYAADAPYEPVETE